MISKYLIIFLLIVTYPVYGGEKISGISCAEQSTPACTYAATLSLARKGDKQAQYNVAGMYYNGKGVVKNLVKASYWYKKVAKQGDMQAETVVGILYFNGEGLQKDLHKASYWWEKAAEKGGLRAQTYIADAYYKGEGVAKDYKKAAYWYEEAAKQGDNKSQKIIATFYKKGFFVAKDLNKAEYWFSRANPGEGKLSQQEGSEFNINFGDIDKVHLSIFLITCIAIFGLVHLLFKRKRNEDRANKERIIVLEEYNEELSGELSNKDREHGECILTLEGQVNKSRKREEYILTLEGHIKELECKSKKFGNALSFRDNSIKSLKKEVSQLQIFLKSAHNKLNQYVPIEHSQVKCKLCGGYCRVGNICPHCRADCYT